MATGNFSFENRCVVVTNEDYKCGNVPSHDEYVSGTNHSYPSYILDNYDGSFKYWNIVLSSGYYEAACIDYIENDYASNYDYRTDMYDSVKEFLDDLYIDFKGILSKNYLNKLFKGFKDFGGDLWKFLDMKLDLLDEHLKDLERLKVDEVIDHIKEEYGYSEYGIYARFNNGETMYSKI